MISIYSSENGRLSKETVEDKDLETAVVPKTWIDIDNPDEDLLKRLSKITQIPFHFLVSALDEEERARIDTEDNSVLVVLDSPSKDPDARNLYITAPFIIAYNDSYFVTICVEHSPLVDLVLAKVHAVQPSKHVRLTLDFIYFLARVFILRLHEIDDQTDDIERRLHSSLKNKELFDQMNLNKTLVYYTTALSADKIVLSKLLKSPNYKKYEEDFDLMEDTEVELDQAIEMCAVYRDILNGMMDAYASIISNNLNSVMKTLTIITIVISIPTLIASLWGMNFSPEESPLPFWYNAYGFYIVIAIGLGLALLCAIGLYFVGKTPFHKPDFSNRKYFSRINAEWRKRDEEKMKAIEHKESEKSQDD